MALDRDQTPDDDEPRRTRQRQRWKAGLDPVVDDLEGVGVEPFALGEIAGEPGGDRDVDVREPSDRPVAKAEEATVAKRVEPVLRADADGDTGERPREEAVEVGMDEVRVEDVRAMARGRCGARARTSAGSRRPRTAAGERRRPTPRAGPRAPRRPPRPRGASRARRRTPRARVRAGGEGGGSPSPRSPRPSRRAGPVRSPRQRHDVVGPRLDRVLRHDDLAKRSTDRVALDARTQPIARTSPSTSPCRNWSSGGSSVSNAWLEAITGMHVAAAS